MKVEKHFCNVETSVIYPCRYYFNLFCNIIHEPHLVSARSYREGEKEEESITTARVQIRSNLRLYYKRSCTWQRPCNLYEIIDAKSKDSWPSSRLSLIPKICYFVTPTKNAKTSCHLQQTKKLPHILVREGWLPSRRSIISHEVIVCRRRRWCCDLR